MKTLILKSSTVILAAQVVQIKQALANMPNPGALGGDQVSVEIIYDPTAPSLATYAHVAATLIETYGSHELCYAGYLAAIAAGVPQDVAYALYLACLAL